MWDVYSGNSSHPIPHTGDDDLCKLTVENLIAY